MKIFKLDKKGIYEYQQNREPYLMIDNATEVIPGVSAKGYKDFEIDEWFFKVHWKNDPNVPGMLQIEALVQMAALSILCLPGNKGKITHALSHEVRFRKEVLPGKKFILKTKVESWKRGICKGFGEGIVDGEIACEATMTITIPEILEQYLPKK